MPQISRWYIRTSLLYFVASLLIGIPLSLRASLSLPPVFGTMAPAYFHLFLVGWIMQLIFGVIFWLFPKPAGKLFAWEPAAWGSWGLLNCGLLLRAVAEPLATRQPGSPWGWALVISALLQWLAGLALIVIVWPRAYERNPRRR
jgi:hypothetical protein